SIMAGLQKLTGGPAGDGQIGQAADAIKHLADDLNKQSAQISPGLTQFSTNGLKQFEAFAVDRKRTLSELQKTIKNIHQPPSRLLFGRCPLLVDRLFCLPALLGSCSCFRWVTARGYSARLIASPTTSRNSRRPTRSAEIRSGTMKYRTRKVSSEASNSSL